MLECSNVLQKKMEQADKFINIDDIIDYCDANIPPLSSRKDTVACAALRRVKEFVKENIAAVQPVTHWISVKERLPEKEQKVLVFYKAIGEKNRIHNDVIATNWRKSNGDFIPVRDYEITHWMPLPEPPKDGKHD